MSIIEQGSLNVGLQINYVSTEVMIVDHANNTHPDLQSTGKFSNIRDLSTLAPSYQMKVAQEKKSDKDHRLLKRP